ncbi:long-chain-fatty-acid--CoA ligase [Nocardioides lianchengensis]|uniref:Acyl-CoA synthetase (AMP-forming)/AMP-acid ligase II n=1 Tax=Nocardioides lianchengensis TaxID=1045774 RepID=A0A1G6IH04_9ACTN|nr:long-chain-fatty-acid--CoA ligase [Nocardioides lianchengensis]NYG13045.1 acyl-CoA synthetase (AMP-forming)/AMP-acid ligase II [Nocardioides lianchengensis]SDC05799.1 Acyl-CoA synthetase (AMP-forming)/AMP-acid ligase II [Nocardioides lianchengensis]
MNATAAPEAVDAATHTPFGAAPVARFVDDRVAHWAATRPDAECLTYLGRTWTWREWDDRVRRAAGGLQALGIGRGDVVAFLDKNHPACVEISLGAGSLGAANAIINWRLAGDEIDYAVNDSGARVLVVGTELVPAIERIRDRLTQVETIIEVTPDGAEGDAYEAFLAAATPVGRSADVEPDDVCLVMYSSGTTGRPKGVMLTHTNMVEHTVCSHEGLTLDADDKMMVAMPLFHVGGSSYVLLGMHDGVASVMTREPDGASLAGAILNGANRTFLVPAVLAQVLQAGPDAVRLFGALKTYTYGASPMPLPLLRAAMEAWPDTDFVQVYGLTEVAGVATHLMPEDHRDPDHPERLVSAGRPIPGVEVRIVDPGTLEDLPVGEHGEIWLRSKQVMKGFLGKPEETAQVLVDGGWFRTGDMGKVDDGGYVFVEDRLKDMIISGGENIYSPEIERVLAEHPAVMEVAIIGVPDDRWGESVKAVVALKPDTSATEDELIAWCREHLAHYKCPKSVDVLDLLPRNPTGKILKRELRAPYWEGRERSVN